MVEAYTVVAAVAQEAADSAAPMCGTKRFLAAESERAGKLGPRGPRGQAGGLCSETGTGRRAVSAP